MRKLTAGRERNYDWHNESPMPLKRLFTFTAPLGDRLGRSSATAQLRAARAFKFLYKSQDSRRNARIS